MIRVFEMFAGYGGASFGLKKAGIPFKVIGYSEIDKFAIKCYEQNHGNIKNFGDCRKINPNKLPDFDLLTGGFPCQPFSVAGKGLGELDTRGTLFYDIIRIAEAKQPKYMLLENVKGLTTKRHKQTFKKILSELNRIGYLVKWAILNSKDYGIPQNRERVWFVCFRKDLKDEFDTFKFPEKEELKLYLKDILEDDVDKKYYLSEQAIERILVRGKGKIDKLIAKTVTAQNNYKGGKRANIVLIRIKNNKENLTLRTNNISFTLTSTGRNCGNNMGIIKIKYGTHQQDCFYDSNGIMGTILAGTHGSTPHLTKTLLPDRKTIRKLTPKECFRLMGFLNDEINLDGLSDTQKYKLAGNGWDINLVSKIFKQMFKKVI